MPRSDGLGLHWSSWIFVVLVAALISLHHTESLLLNSPAYERNLMYGLHSDSQILPWFGSWYLEECNMHQCCKLRGRSGRLQPWQTLRPLRFHIPAHECRHEVVQISRSIQPPCTSGKCRISSMSPAAQQLPHYCGSC